jgi:hypothetical protein
MARSGTNVDSDTKSMIKRLSYVAVAEPVLSVATLIPLERVVISNGKL